MMRLHLLFSFYLLLLGYVCGDVYMHQPRGSNNRLNEKSANRNNGNRLFDSQNNNRGGYNVGDKTDNANTNTADPDGMTGDNPSRGFDLTKTGAQQYPMVYLEGSVVNMEWTSQHACGGNEATDTHKTNCNYVVQYACDTDATVTDKGMTVLLRDGADTNTPREPTTTATTGIAQINTQKTANDAQAVRGRQESEAYYYECKVRQRNKGLFVADQKLKGDTTKYTRQNPGGTRRGLECPEERDYYPYWSPSPWRDVAYLSEDLQWCQDNIVPESQNTKTKYKCADPSGQMTKTHYAKIHQDECEAVAGAQWTGFTHSIAAPECALAHWNRENHLGNGRDGQPNQYNWTLPTYTSLASSGVQGYDSVIAANKFARCALRLRYNITTDDYDPYLTFSDQNGEDSSPITQNPVIDIGGDITFTDTDQKEPGVRLAINTAQTGRVFQDRSHVFYIHQQTTAVKALLTGNSKILNLNVRGKRGNIVQTYPAVEYDFSPNNIEIRAGDILHVQWTGSNTHNNAAPGGDGQTGDDGQGTGGTDRSNIVETTMADVNYPIPVDKMDSMFEHFECYTLEGVPVEKLDCQVWLTTSGHFRSKDSAVEDSADNPFNPLLNTSPASLVQGLLLKAKTTGKGKSFHYICSRNNNFSNRSQKGVITIAA